MTRLQKTVVYAANAAGLGDLVDPTRAVATSMLTAAGSVHNTVYGLDWRGDTQNACDGRADRELAQDRRVAAGYEALAAAYRSGADTMGPMISSLQSQGTGFQDDSFAVSEDWVVTDTYDYEFGKFVMMLTGSSDEAAQSAMDDLKKQRGDEATNGTIALQNLANELTTADTNTKNAIDTAKNDITANAPIVAGLAGGQQASDDAQAVLAGTATPQQVARVRAALTTWTPEQLAALSEGNPADMPQGQYDYLTALMEAMGGKTVQDINAAAEKYGLQGAMGDGLRMLGTPNIQTKLGDHGGLGELPASVRGVLTQDIRSGDLAVLVPLSEFDTLNRMLDPSNKGLARGSDVDRALFSQAAKIVGGMDHSRNTIDMAQNNGHSSDGWTPDEVTNKVVNSMLSNAAVDHQAVTNFLVAADYAQTPAGAVQDPQVLARMEEGAAAMNRATEGHFGGQQAFLDLVTHQFAADQTGARDMFGWQGAAAYSPGVEGQNAAASAGATAHLLSENVTMLGAEAGDHALGRVNPELTRTLVANLTPYVGDLLDVDTPGIHGGTIDAFDTTGDLTNLVKVFNTDPQASQGFHIAAAGWENYFAHEYGETGQQSVAQAAGNITQAVNTADVDHLNTLKDQQRWDDINNFGSDGANWDSAKALVTNGGKLIPGIGTAGEWIARAVDIVSPQAKLDILGSLGPHPSDNQWQQAMTAIQTDFQNSVGGPYHEYALTGGYLQSHPEAIAQFRNVEIPDVGPVNFVDSHGNPNWDTINQYPNDFAKPFNELPLGDWGNDLNGYGWGVTEPTIEKLPAAPAQPVDRPPTAERPHK